MQGNKQVNVIYSNRNPIINVQLITPETVDKVFKSRRYKPNTSGHSNSAPENIDFSLWLIL